MKKHELQLKRTKVINKMSALIDIADVAERSLTEDENTTYDSYRAELVDLAGKITRAEELEELQRSIAPTADNADTFVPPTANLKTKNFNIATAMRQASEGTLSGDVKSIHERGESQGVSATNRNTILIPLEAINSKRAGDLTVTTGADLIHKDVASDLDIIVPDPLYRKLGIRILNGLNGNLGLPAQSHNIATFPGEENTVLTASNKPTGVTLTPQRVGITEKVSKELMNSGHSSLFSAIISDMVAGIDSAISIRTLTRVSVGAVAGNVVDGSGLTGGYNDITAKLLADLEAKVEIDGRFVFPRGGFAALKSKPLTDGDSKTILNGKFSNGATHDGYDAFGTSFCPAGTVLYGAFEHVTLGMWDGIEIIVDPYTRAKFGEVEITVNRLVDVQVRNGEAFAVINNIP
jgi:HK97 family phage major capsid protein